MRLRPPVRTAVGKSALGQTAASAAPPGPKVGSSGSSERPSFVNGDQTHGQLDKPSYKFLMHMRCVPNAATVIALN